MGLRKDLVLLQHNNETLNLSVIDQVALTPINLTGKTLTIYIKGTPYVSDSDPSVVTLSSGGGSPAITITSAVGGLATCAVSSTVLAAAGTFWWRMDVVEDHKTAMYGDWIVLPD